ncbi:MAG: thiamine phosphate synthase [Lachnospiraceae bacterium]|nr:thiamine phosphate synthase [Lachnospiraceae bacterium]
MQVKKEDMCLYLVTDRAWLKDKSLYEQVEEALKGGVTMVQLREKSLREEEMYAEAVELKKLCRQYQVPFIINDDVALALKVDADGVHVGQSDMNPARVRKMIGKDKILGVTAKTVEQARRAEEEGADYLGSGAVFHTGTKTDTKELDHAVLQEICESVRIPVVAIGGISAKNVHVLRGRGISGIATVSGILAQPDIKVAAETLHSLVDKFILEK